MSESEVIDVEATEIPMEMELRPSGPPPTLFRTDDPIKVLARATETANALRDVISKRRLYVNISGKSHITVEGWQTLGAMLGVTSVCEWTRPVEDGWEARVVARTLDGRDIGAAEAMCLSSEGKPWSTAKDHALRSMAQTRATSKALASVLRFVITLAGYEGTPAEEADGSVEAVAEPAEAVDVIDAGTVDGIVGGIKALGLNYRAIGLMLGAAGLDGLRANSPKAVRERVESLTPAQAEALYAEMEKADDA